MSADAAMHSEQSGARRGADPVRVPMRVLGIDTSLRSTGVAVVEAAGSRLVPVEFGVIRNPRELRLSACLDRLSAGIREVIARAQPREVAVEGVFYCRNARTAMVLGEARGAAIAACAALGLPVFEYAPRRVKQAVTGYGAASKEQVRKTLATLLGIRGEIREDAGDALAIALCHQHSRTRHAALMPREI